MKYHVTLVGVSFMLTHFHLLVRATTMEDITRFMESVMSVYVRIRNAETGRTGPLIQGRYGSAVKLTEKKCRSAIAYLYNNPVEKKLCGKAIENRWNFLAYAYSKCPFSIPIDRKAASRKMLRSMKLVDENARSWRHLNYGLLTFLFDGIRPNETNQLIDYIIQAYSKINYQESIKYFGSLDKMVTAIDSNTGDEWSIKEQNEENTFVPYLKMQEMMENEFPEMLKSEFCLMSNEGLAPIVKRLVTTHGTNSHISKFLHVDLNIVKEILGPDYLRFRR